jgi:phytochrome-interacting factor 4
MGFYHQQQQSPAPPTPAVPAGSLPAATARALPSDGKKYGTQHRTKIKYGIQENVILLV